MPYDCYTTICKPLHYTSIMNERACTIFVLFFWLLGLIVTLPLLTLGIHLDFCHSNLIHHFGCDMSPLWKIVCSNTPFVDQLALVLAVLTLIFILVCVVVSYTYIIRSTFRSLQLSKEKGFLHLFSPQDCSFCHLWKLHLNLYKTTKGRCGHE